MDLTGIERSILMFASRVETSATWIRVCRGDATHPPTVLIGDARFHGQDLVDAVRSLGDKRLVVCVHENDRDPFEEWRLTKSGLAAGRWLLEEGPG